MLRPDTEDLAKEVSDLLKKLNLREIQCIENMSTYTVCPVGHFNLSYEAHPNVPNVLGCLQFKNNGSKGH